LTPRRAGRQGLAIASPFLSLKLKVPLFKLVLAKVMGASGRTLTMGNELVGEDVSRNRRGGRPLTRTRRVHHVATPRWFNELGPRRRASSRRRRRCVPRLFAARRPGPYRFNDVALGFARDAGSIMEVKVYNNLFHEMFLEPSATKVIADMFRWLVNASGR